jgi:hypothetical protein
MGIKNATQWRERIDTQPASKRAEEDVTFGAFRKNVHPV